MNSEKIPSFIVHRDYMNTRITHMNESVDCLLDSQTRLKAMALEVQALKKKGLTLDQVRIEMRKSCYAQPIMQMLAVMKENKKLDYATVTNDSVLIQPKDVRPLTSILTNGSFSSKAVDICCGKGVKGTVMMKHSDSVMADISDCRAVMAKKFKFVEMESIYSLHDYDVADYKWRIMINCEHFLLDHSEVSVNSSNLFMVRKHLPDQYLDGSIVDVALSGMLYKQRVIKARTHELIMDNHVFTYKFVNATVNIKFDKTKCCDLQVKSGLPPIMMKNVNSNILFYEKIDGIKAHFKITDKQFLYKERGWNYHYYGSCDSPDMELVLERKGQEIYILRIVEYEGFKGLFVQNSIESLLESVNFDFNGMVVVKQNYVNDVLKIPLSWEGVVIKKGLPQLESYAKWDYTADINNKSIWLSEYGIELPLHEDVKEYKILGKKEAPKLCYLRDRPDKLKPNTKQEFCKMLKAPKIIDLQRCYALSA